MLTIQKQALGQCPTVVVRPMDFRELRTAWNALKNATFIEGRKVVSVDGAVIATADGTRYFKG